MLDPGLAHLFNELAAFPRRRRIGAGVLESGHQPDSLDLDLAALKHKGKVADGFFDLERRRLGFLFRGGAASAWICASTKTKTKARNTQVTPGMDRHIGLPPCAALGENPRTRLENRDASFDHYRLTTSL